MAATHNYTIMDKLRKLIIIIVIIIIEIDIDIVSNIDNLVLYSFRSFCSLQFDLILILYSCCSLMKMVCITIELVNSHLAWFEVPL